MKTPMMIDRIKNNETLQHFLKHRCSENEVDVNIDKLIDEDRIVILAPDEYYNSLGLEKTPPSADCLIIVKCRNGGYALTIIELKDISSGKGFTLENLIAKFETTLSDFISNRFREEFEGDLKRVQLYFISNIDIYKRDIGLKMDILINTVIKFQDKKVLIKPFMPTPLIKDCY